MSGRSHRRLVLPGPVEVRHELLEAQANGLIGHRTAEFAELYARIQEGLRRVFLTEQTVFAIGASGTGFWEGAARNCIRPGRRVLHCVGGSFGERWRMVSQSNGCAVDSIVVEWGQAHTVAMVADALDRGEYDALCVVHNETSTGVINPLREICALLRDRPDTLLLVDCVSSALGAELRVDEWGIDVALTSSQKCFGLSPGLAFAAVSEAALARAQEIAVRGYYFDFLELARYGQRHQTPSTPPVSLLFAADRQLQAVLAEGLAARWARHAALAELTQRWALARGFGLFAEEGARSPTVTAVDNRERGIDVAALVAFARRRGYEIDAGYGKIKGKTYRIAHMGDLTIAEMEAVLAVYDEFLQQS
ncbi:MAG: alanine--glyoxylate aminotransferase family protein [Chloroflexi bacterium]|nr:alanine--glyoxylate aminotransferase family protein [Chloroflexota bacterium]